MTQITVKSDRKVDILPLISSAIDREANIIYMGIKRTKENLKYFERKYKIQTGTFYKRFQHGKMGDSMDFIEWAGEYEILQNLLKEYDELREAKVC